MRKLDLLKYLVKSKQNFRLIISKNKTKLFISCNQILIKYLKVNKQSFHLVKNVEVDIIEINWKHNSKTFVCATQKNSKLVYKFKKGKIETCSLIFNKHNK